MSLPARNHLPLGGHSCCSFALAFDASGAAVIIAVVVIAESFHGNSSHPAPQPFVCRGADHRVTETFHGHGENTLQWSVVKGSRGHRAFFLFWFTNYRKQNTWFGEIFMCRPCFFFSVCLFFDCTNFLRL